MEGLDVETARKACGFWDDELDECDEEYPEECPYHEECKREAESDGE